MASSIFEIESVSSDGYDIPAASDQSPYTIYSIESYHEPN